MPASAQAAKTDSIDQHRMLEQWWPGNCCLCRHAERITQLEIELAIYKPEPQTPHTGYYRCEFCGSTEILHIEEGLQCWKQQALNERHDVEMICHEVGQVYAEITFGRFSKPNTSAQYILDRVQELEEEHVKDALEFPLDVLEWAARYIEGDNHEKDALLLAIDQAIAQAKRP